MREEIKRFLQKLFMDRTEGKTTCWEKNLVGNSHRAQIPHKSLNFVLALFSRKPK